MSRYDQDWVDAITSDAGGVGEGEPLRLLYSITDTDDGKAAFHLDIGGGSTRGVAGKLPRGEKADLTITAKEVDLVDVWSGVRSRDAAFMSGDLKVEGGYERWLNELIPLFENAPWSDAWAHAVR